MPVVFITGAVKNTGLAIARKFAENGYDVAVSSRRRDDAEKTAALLSSTYSVKAVGYSLDLTDTSDIERVFAAIKTDFSQLDAFVANSANLGINSDMLSVTPKDFDDLMNVNLKGTYFCAKSAALIMKEQKSGSIVLISSVHSHECMPGRSLYTVSKGGLNALSRSMAIELGKYGIRSNCIIAGAIKTDRWNDLTEEQIRKKRENWPIGLESTGEDIANGVFYLGSDLSKTVTGSELAIDSGILVSLLPYNGGKS